MIENVVVGADPELFLTDLEGNYKSAVGQIGGSKRHPLKITSNGHALQEDNVAVEFNIPPAKSVEDFCKDIKFMLSVIEEKVKNKFKLSFDPAVLFPPEELDTPQAKRFACIPDYNVWTDRPTVVPRYPPPLDRLRTAGGHIHIGWDKPNKKDRINLIKALDLFYSVPMSVIETPNLRRNLYGKAGCYRSKPYGVEYRTPSNYWLTTKDLQEFVFNSVESAVNFVNTGKTISDKDGELIKRIVDQDELTLVPELFKKYGM